jgi:hypothetical protein
MDDYVVVVIRLKAGEDLLAILNGELDNRVLIEHPYYVTYDPSCGNVTMIPYCPLTDEFYFEINRSEINFLVTASRDIATKFLSMVSAAIQVPEAIGEDYTADDVGDLTVANMQLGNTTKH